MTPGSEPSPYRTPAALRDLVMVDLLEITGSTTATAGLLTMSQPNVSRRYRALAQDLNLGRCSDAPVGQRFSDAPWITQLRRGVNHHRLARGCLRVGGASNTAALLSDAPWVQWVHVGRTQLDHWPRLLRLELLDAVLWPREVPADVMDQADVALVELRCGRDCSAWLACRRDPLVLEVISRITARMEVG
jgi:hypothetical protein